METHDDNESRTAEILEALVKQLSEKDKADSARDEAERKNAKKTQHLYLGIVATILTLFSSVFLQLGTPPRIAEKSDILTVLKQNQGAARPDPWTGSNDLAAMSGLRMEQKNYRDKIWNAVEDNQKALTQFDTYRITIGDDHDNIWKSIHILEESVKEKGLIKWRIQQLEENLNGAQ